MSIRFLSRNLARQQPGLYRLAPDHLVTRPRVALDSQLSHQIGLALVDLVQQVDDAKLVREPWLDGDLGVDAADLVVLDEDSFLSASRTASRNGRPECSSRSWVRAAVLILLFPSTIRCGPCTASLRRSRRSGDLAQVFSRPRHRGHLHLEEAELLE